MINGKTLLFGLIGFPITHSFSPHIHNYLFKKYNLDAVYVCLETEEGNFKTAVQGTRSLGIKGMNVTIPYKEKIIPYLERISKEAKAIGAVNTIQIIDRNMYGFNTDGEGFLRSLKQFKVDIAGKNVCICGAGGAAKAIGVYLAREKVSSIYFYDIFYSKACQLAKKIKNCYPKIKIVAVKNKQDIDLGCVDLLVNATGIGRKKTDPLVIDLCAASGNLVVYDLIYNPLKPRLLVEAEKRGLKTINGLWMLIYQALEAEKIWWGRDFSSCAQALYKELLKWQ